MPGTVAVDCFPENVEKYRNGWVVVAVDVIRATTTAITGVAQGFMTAFPDMKVLMDDVSVDGDQAVYRWT